MRFALFAALAFSLAGCSLLRERAPDYAQGALDSAADRTTGLALDKAEDAVRSGASSESPSNQADQVTRRVDDDDVLVEQGGNFVVGKPMGRQVLIIRTGEKVEAAGREIIPIRRANKSDLKVGRDVFFTTAKGDVRRATWSLGAVTDDATLSDGTVAVGPESDLDWQGQVAVRR